MIIFGVLHCGGDFSDKVTLLFIALQSCPHHAHISHDDKDYKPVLEKIAKFATLDLADIMKSIDPVIPSPFEQHQDKIKQLIEDDHEEDSMKSKWKVLVYGEYE